MKKSDIKKSVNSQMLTVFFMPLAVTGIHMLFAFHMIELMLNAANINFAVFNNLLFPDGHEGVFFAIFAIAIAAAESAIAIAIMINIYRQLHNISVAKLTKMKW